MRILIPWPKWQLFGGLGRMVNIQRFMKTRGHRVELCALTEVSANPWGIKTLTYSQASKQIWDATLIPGAGVPGNVLPRFQRLRVKGHAGTQFGLRVLFVLSDATVQPRYRKMRDAFQPHVVIWNNDQWTNQEMKGLADKANPYVLLGAVDLGVFRDYRPTAWVPLRYWDQDMAKHRALIVGGYAAKSSRLILWLQRQEWPFLISFVLFGTRYGQAEKKGASEADLRKADGGLCGRKTGHHLAEFYNSCHVVLCDDSRAGWNNVAAEAMACGCVVMSRPHGVQAFLKPDVNGILVQDRQPRDRFYELLLAINQHRQDGKRMGKAATATMKAWSWERYCEQLERILKDEIETHRG